jgi:hypothetical protein
MIPRGYAAHYRQDLAGNPGWHFRIDGNGFTPDPDVGMDGMIDPFCVSWCP